MKLNCKPGDLAIVVRGRPTHNLGSVVRVIRLAQDAWEIWEYEGRLTNTRGGRITGIGDECLRPIRDPGDDAVDETLAWAGAPAGVPA